MPRFKIFQKVFFSFFYFLSSVFFSFFILLLSNPLLSPLLPLVLFSFRISDKIFFEIRICFFVFEGQIQIHYCDAYTKRAYSSSAEGVKPNTTHWFFINSVGGKGGKEGKPGGNEKKERKIGKNVSCLANFEHF